MAKHVSWAACWASFLQCTVVRWCRPYMWYLVSKIISNEKSKRKKTYIPIMMVQETSATGLLSPVVWSLYHHTMVPSIDVVAGI
jgi:hypothetical protein